MFKTGLSSSLYDEFLDSYQSLSTSDLNQHDYFVYAGEEGIKYLASIDGESEGELFATSIASDGWIELLSM